jgi:PAS domain S-box-containing protein
MNKKEKYEGSGFTDKQFQKEIDEKRHVEEELHRSHILLDAITDAQSHFITDPEEWVLFDGLLKNLLKLTKSEYGFIGEILFNPAGEPYFKTKALTNITWNDETQEFFKKNAPDGMEFYNTKTFFNQVMITGKPVIANYPPNDKRRGGLPPECPPLISFLGVPFYHGKKLVGMAGIANCPGGYKEELIEDLRPLFTTCANIIEAYRNENKRKMAEEELVHRTRLAELGNEIGIALSHRDSLQNILQRCTESIVKNLDSAFARIWTFNQRDGVLELQASAGIYTHINGGHSRIPIGMYKIGRIAKDRKPHLTNRVIGDPEVNDQEWAIREKMVSFAGYPLIVEGWLVGVMAMFSRQPLMNFSLKALSSVADNIANGIERKKTEKEKERYIEAINKATDGITIADEIDRYIYINSAYVNIFGYTQDELMGGTWRKITPPGLITSVEKGLSHTMHNKNVGVFKGDVTGLRKNGTILPIEVTGTGFWDEDGRYRGHVCIVRDITERKQADEKIKQSEEKYRDLFQNANDAICIVDSDLKYKDVNNKTVEMFGYTKEELLNMSVYDLIPCEQIPISEIEFDELRKKGSYEKFVGKARTKNGRLIDVEVSSSVIKEGGNIIGSRDIIRDVTERAQNEEALRESEERYRTIIEYSNDMIWTLDNEGCFLFFNKRSEEITGYRLEDWKGKSFAPLISEKDLPNVIEIFHKIMEGQSQQYEVVVKNKDGSDLIISVNTAPIYSKGKVVGTVSFGRDITDRKRAEDVIKESEIRLQSIMDNSSTVVFLKDIHGRYITVNRRYEELFHVNRNEVVNKTDYDIFPREFADKFRRHDGQVLEKLCSIEMEEEVPQEDGLHTYISVKFPLLSPEGKPYAVCGISTDITERKKAQEQIEKSLKEKEVLLREVYHRVKNNMQIITSLLNLQSRYARDGEYREMFRESHNRIKSMSLVHEKLYQSKDLSTIDFKEYIKDIAKGLFLSYGANKGKILLVMDINNISLNINTAIPCGLIINELVTNSLKHAFPEGKEGEIKISVHSMNENTIELVVGDNGIGIPEDVDFKTTESLGLQLVTMLSENQLHGKIILDRSQGTEFSITFKEVK